MTDFNLLCGSAHIIGFNSGEMSTEEFVNDHGWNPLDSSDDAVNLMLSGDMEVKTSSENGYIEVTAHGLTHTEHFPDEPHDVAYNFRRAVTVMASMMYHNGHSVI